MNKELIKLGIISFLLYFLSWLFVYIPGINNLAVQSEDTVPTMYLSLALAKDFTMHLDPYVDEMINRYPQPDDKARQLGLIPYYLRVANEHYLSAFPVITSVLAAPVFKVYLTLSKSFVWQDLVYMSHISSALIMSGGVMLFYYLVKGVLLIDSKKSMLLTFIYGFGTVNYAVNSQSLWQHGPVQIFSLFVVINYLRYLQTKKNVYLLFLGFSGMTAFLTRPTALLVLTIFSISLLLSKEGVKRFFYICAGTLVPLAFFIWYNFVFYKSIANQGYSDQLFSNWLGGFPLSFVGVWLSPSKGILVYSPIFIFSIVGFVLIVKNKVFAEVNRLYLLSFLTIVLHTLVMSFWKHWYGGWSFGYRMSSDVIPFFILLLIPFLQSAYFQKYIRLFFAAVFLSVAIQVAGLFFYDGIWHAAYDKGFHDTGWLWSVKDSEAAFNARRILVKLGYLQKACPTCDPIK